jgi:adenylosuccinate synthase
MANVVVVGAQWGDEGKGKIVDWLSERADVIARFQGGHNAGPHAGRGRDGLQAVASALGHRAAEDKLGARQRRGARPLGAARGDRQAAALGVAIGPETLMLAENTPLILPLHQDLDRLREEAAGAARIGTTGRGIGAGLRGQGGARTVRVADLADEGTLDTRLDAVRATTTRCAAG